MTDSNDLDDFGKDIAIRARSARRNHGGHPNGAWSTGEQLAVALVLRDQEHLDLMGYTTQEAAHRVYAGMIAPPSDFNGWLDSVREAADASVWWY